MALVRTNLAMLANAGNGGPRLWSYVTTDLATDVDTTDYFLGSIEDLNVGDVIFASVDTDGTPGYGIFVVNLNNGTSIDVANLTSLAAADTD